MKLLMKVYANALITLMQTVDASWPSCCGCGLGKLMIDGGSSFGEMDDEYDEESDGRNVGVAR